MRTPSTMTHHGVHWSPESRTGRWTVALAATALAGLVLLALGVGLGLVESAASFSDSWLLTGWGVAVLGSALASVVVGALAVVRRHERSWTVYLAALFGLLVAAVLLQEVAQGL